MTCDKTTQEQVQIDKIRKLQEEGMLVFDPKQLSASAKYDLIRDDSGQLCRVKPGLFAEPLLKGPLPDIYWSLPIYTEPEKCATRLDKFVDFVWDLKDLSKCNNRKTAAIITDKDMQQIYSIGINGGPRGSQYQCLCNLPGKYTCIHAETNAIAKCHTPDASKVMICTLSPCITCASLIVNSGFSELYYIEEWKDTTGLQILSEAGIKTTQVRR